MKYLSFFLLFLSLLSADRLRLEDGSSLNGYITYRSNDRIVIVSNGINHIIPTDKIKFMSLNKNFTRVEDNQFQVKIVRYKKDGKMFTICSAVHLADKSYYRKLESILDKNQLVLFEAYGVLYNKDFSRWVIPTKRYHDKIERYKHPEDNLWFIAKLFDLSLQLEELNTDKPFWEPSDISHAQFKFLLKKRTLQEFMRGIPEPKQDYKREGKMNKLLQELESNPNNAKLKRFVLKKYAEETAHGENDSFGTYMKVILLDRNKQVLEDIYECLRNKNLKTIGVVYGAYHMKDIVTHIEKNGFEFVEEFFISAWSLK